LIPTTNQGLRPIELAGKVAIAAVTGNAGGVDAFHRSLHLLDAAAIGGGLQFGGLLAQRARFGKESGAVGRAHRNAAGDARQVVGGLAQRIGQCGDLFELIRLGCRCRVFRLLRQARRPNRIPLAQLCHDQTQTLVRNPVAAQRLSRGRR
jgi:hypothetical protein